ncbi:MAG: hypothetical protein QNJ63_26700 [Calothrix sp. MO_192.B10]|nr:hypothetical protein [Calothrix sp. MO_192.B10]
MSIGVLRVEQFIELEAIKKPETENWEHQANMQSIPIIYLLVDALTTIMQNVVKNNGITAKRWMLLIKAGKIRIESISLCK